MLADAEPDATLTPFTVTVAFGIAGGRCNGY